MLTTVVSFLVAPDNNCKKIEELQERDKSLTDEGVGLVTRSCLFYFFSFSVFLWQLRVNRTHLSSYRALIRTCNEVEHHRDAHRFSRSNLWIAVNSFFIFSVLRSNSLNKEKDDLVTNSVPQARQVSCFLSRALSAAISFSVVRPLERRNLLAQLRSHPRVHSHELRLDEENNARGRKEMAQEVIFSSRHGSIFY